ncbi:hypothetical protein K788_0006777 [Paraburkholderia caribensis MBA4]|uniref:Uncharacterized protein n=1 Tax=Paraburkholderia caribensis MBA4 TaxID=1323664 RepID=A0A0P0R566_9BURK|nr:hypothetical protein K788_0006777 [Paraburkholderia caribensis MBA4]
MRWRAMRSARGAGGGARCRGRGLHRHGPQNQMPTHCGVGIENII